jgi:hypothetical protein
VTALFTNRIIPVNVNGSQDVTEYFGLLTGKHINKQNLYASQYSVCHTEMKECFRVIKQCDTIFQHHHEYHTV